MKLAIRKGRNEVEWRFEHEWPLARTQWTKFYFDLSQAAPANAGRLVAANPQACSSRTYPASSLGSMGSTSAASSQVMGGAIPPGMGIALETPPLTQDVEVTGPVAAVLWVASSTEDMDLFLTIRNIDGDGNEVLETGQQGTPVPVAKGWLRVSHRELDPELSLPYRPYHRHQRRLYLTPGEIVRVEVEIWPTSMVFKKGHRIRLDVQPAMASVAAPTRTTMPTTTAGRTRSMRAARRTLICCCRSFRRIGEGGKILRGGRTNSR